MKKIFLGAIFLLCNRGFAGEFLVKYRHSGAFQVLRQMEVEKSGRLMVLDHHDAGGYIKVNIPKKFEVSTLVELMSNSAVEYVVPNFKLHSFSSVPVDGTALKDQWAISKVQAEKAWAKAGNKGSKKILLAVIDTGSDYKHKSLSSNMVPGFDFKDKDNDPMDLIGSANPGHGTHCAGIIGANGVVDGGIVGISPELSIMPLRFLGADGSGSLDDGIKAIDYAIEKGVMVISASWGAAVPRAQAQPLIDAIKRADDKGIIFVAAAANDGKNNDKTDVFPANSGLPNTITVAASGDKDEKPSWSNFGKATVHVAAPGLNIMSTLPNDAYGNLSGTSMATPLVAGLVAFLKAQDESLTGAQIRAILQTTGAKVSIETACNCRVDALGAVESVLAKKMVVVPSAATLTEKGTLPLSILNGRAPFKFVSSNPSAVTISDAGVVSGLAKGSSVITVTDASGVSASTLDIFVGASGDGGGGGGGADCPFGDAATCEAMCQIVPTFPWCKAN
jgi:thermitase